MYKRGQFYLIAAIVIVTIIISLGVVYNRVHVTAEESKIYDLSEEINFEAAQIIDNGVLTGSLSNVSSRIENLTDAYSKSNPNQDFFLVFGDGETGELSVLYYNKSKTGSIGISAGGSIFDQELDLIRKGRFKSESGLVEIEISDEVSRQFNLKPGQNFYILITKSKEGEKLVASNE